MKNMEKMKLDAARINAKVMPPFAEGVYLLHLPRRVGTTAGLFLSLFMGLDYIESLYLATVAHVA